jgi:phasin family protein
MSTFPEQFSEARNSQLDAQFDIIRTVTATALDNVEKIFALNFDASRASIEKSSALMRQMMAVKDPRDLFAMTSHGQSQFDSVMAYGRQLFSIVAIPAVADASQAAAPAAAAGEAPAAPVQASLTPVAAQTEPEPEPEPAPIAAPNPIARAAGKSGALPQPSAASFPVPSSSKPIEVAPVKPVEAAPPPAPVSGTPEIVTRKAAAPAAKQAKKK